jgi:hypothetical protein
VIREVRNNMGYSKGQSIHKTKRSANRIAKSCREIGMPCKIVKLKKGYRVDKDWS